MTDIVPVRRALLSVSDKTGLIELAQALHGHGVELLSTGGTARALREAGLPVREVSDHTGFPEIMDGRVKTLHPKIHGGLLGRRGVDETVMAEHDIAPIDLLVVNLYPFERTVADPACDDAAGVENIDVGGPAMLRAAAKNHDRVAVLTDPADYPAFLDELGRAGGTRFATRRRLAAKAFARTAAYDAAIARWLEARLEPGGAPFPERLLLAFERREALRYGENPHQRAAFYVEPAPPADSLAAARLRQGKPLSFNNLADADAAWRCVRGFAQPACVIVKHANPCGVAVARDPAGAYLHAWETDRTSAYGGIVAFNRPVDAALAEAVLARQFVEVLIAPGFDDGALARFAAKPNVRLLECAAPADPAPRLDYKRIDGGLLVQEDDPIADDPAGWRVVTRAAPDEAQWRDLAFAWRVVAYVKSNAIVYARDGRTLGIGAGQMSRVFAARIGALKAAEEGLSLAGCVLASDAFFPFRDGVDQAAEAGVRAIVQPGGAKRDEEVIAAADEHGIAMVFTGTRHFRH